MIGTLAVDGWAVIVGTARRGLGGLPSPLLAVPNEQHIHQQPVCQRHIIRYGTINAVALKRVNR